MGIGIHRIVITFFFLFSYCNVNKYPLEPFFFSSLYSLFYLLLFFYYIFFIKFKNCMNPKGLKERRQWLMHNGSLCSWPPSLPKSNLIYHFVPPLFLLPFFYNKKKRRIWIKIKESTQKSKTKIIKK